MNRDELKRILDSRPVGAVTYIDVDTVGGPDRTLLYGFTLERNSWHVYLKDGKIHLVEYDLDQLLRHEARTAWNPEDLMPDKRAYPQSTDAKFAWAVERVGIEVPFTTFSETPDPWNGFYGVVVGDSEPADG